MFLHSIRGCFPLENAINSNETSFPRLDPSWNQRLIFSIYETYRNNFFSPTNWSLCPTNDEKFDEILEFLLFKFNIQSSITWREEQKLSSKLQREALIQSQRTFFNTSKDIWAHGVSEGKQHPRFPTHYNDTKTFSRKMNSTLS